MAQTQASDGRPNVATDNTRAEGVDLIPGGIGDGISVDNDDDALTVNDSDVTTRPAEWMRQPPSNTPTSDYRLRGLDLGAPLIADAPRPSRTKRNRNRRALRRLLIQWTLVLGVVAAVTVALRTYVIEPVTVDSNSMIPTLDPGTSVLVVKWSALIGSTSRGEIVVFRQPPGSQCAPTDGGSHLIARVIGMPGQTIWSRRGRIYVNGAALDERGWYNAPFGEVGTKAIPRTTVPPGSYYLLGDNRTDTCDSRELGPVSGSLVVGKVIGTVMHGGHPYLHSL